jgi:hypothetical protein
MLREEGIDESIARYIVNEVRQFPEDELQQAKTMLDLLEQRRAAHFHNISVLVAAIVGAAIGSGLVLAFSP